MELGHAIIIILIIAAITCIIMQKSQCGKEGLSGYGVTSALAYNNRLSYCQPGSGAWSGGCFLPHRVIV